MGSAIARNDTFIGGVDLIWARIGISETFENPSSPLYGVGANFKLTQTIVTGFGGLRIPVGPPNLELYGTVGARYFDDGVAITLTGPVFGFQRYESESKDWIDPVVGFAAHYRIDPKWFVNAQADIGGLNDSATGQALGSVGYNWTQNIATTLGACSTPTTSRTTGTAVFAIRRGCTGRSPRSSSASEATAAGRTNRDVGECGPQPIRRRCCSAAIAASGADAAAVPIVAVYPGPYDGGAVAVRPVRDDRAVRARASGAVDAARAHRGIGLCDSPGEQAERQQRGNRSLHGDLLPLIAAAFVGVRILSRAVDDGRVSELRGWSANPTWRPIPPSPWRPCSPR